MLYLDIIKIIIKVMKKLVMFSLVALTIQSCGVFKKVEKKETCSQDIINWINYEDTIQVEFKGVDSSLFKGKDYKKVSDSLMWYDNGHYMSIDVQNIKTRYIHRIVFKRDQFERFPYDKESYERVR